MDEYLIKNSSYKRLYEEYKKYGSLVIGFDFDNTVYDYHKTGKSYEMVRQLLRDLVSTGCKTICWTAQKDIDFVANFLDKNDIPYNGINSNGIKLDWESRKPFFSVLLDDRAGLLQVYNDLIKLTKTIRNETNMVV
jgi:hypothetical protein